MKFPRTIVVEGLRTVSGMNAREHKFTRAKRVKAERETVALFLGPSPLFVPWPLRITMTRLAPGVLDSDNLGSALKAVQDEIAKWLSVDDGRAERSGQIEWVRAQRKVGQGAYAVELLLEARGAVTLEGRLNSWFADARARAGAF